MFLPTLCKPSHLGFSANNLLAETYFLASFIFFFLSPAALQATFLAHTGNGVLVDYPKIVVSFFIL